MTNMIDRFNQSQVEKINKMRDFAVPSFRVGDLMCVTMRIKDGAKERLQKFEGRCIAKKNRSLNSSFTIRKSNGTDGLEMIFSVFSPFVKSIDVVKTGKVRKAKLYYIREKSLRQSRIEERDVYRKKKLPVKK